MEIIRTALLIFVFISAICSIYNLFKYLSLKDSGRVADIQFHWFASRMWAATTVTCGIVVVILTFIKN